LSERRRKHTAARGDISATRAGATGDTRQPLTSAVITVRIFVLKTHGGPRLHRASRSESSCLKTDGGPRLRRASRSGSSCLKTDGGPRLRRASRSGSSCLKTDWGSAGHAPDPPGPHGITSNTSQSAVLFGPPDPRTGGVPTAAPVPWGGGGAGHARGNGAAPGTDPGSRQPHATKGIKPKKRGTRGRNRL